MTFIYVTERLSFHRKYGGLLASATIFVCDPKRVALRSVMSKPQGFRLTLVKKVGAR